MRPALGPLLRLLCLAQAMAEVLPGSSQTIENTWRQQWQTSHESEPEYLNRLVLSDSAYLQQHADNPIDWYPWSDEAFARAKADNRLVLLSIGYASCHWCHVMEQESFADPGLAALLNAALVSVKVDREQRPDLDAWYSLVAETVQGEGGWPITLLLTPDRQPVFAAHYVTREQLATLVTRYAQAWQKQPDAVRRDAQMLEQAVRAAAEARNAGLASLDPQWQAQARTRLLATIDNTHGGFGTAQKFPDELKWQFLLDAWKTTPDDDLKRELEQVLLTQLDGMLSSGLVDAVFGGVFRYTTDRERTRPHFEKMLYNQALMVSLYAEAAAWLDRPDYLEFAESIIHFVNSAMRLKSGGFASALDADHDGREGAYYLWARDDLDDLPASLHAVQFGAQDWFLHGRVTSESDRQWLAQRAAARGEPARQIRNEITAWNALWVAALLDAGRLAEAEALANHIWSRAWRDGKLYRMGEQGGMLDDHACLSNALWRLYLKTGAARWKQMARQVDAALLAGFYSSEGLHYHLDGQDGIGNMAPWQDSELPAPGALALAALSRHRSDGVYAEAADSSWALAGGAMARSPEHHVSLLRAAWPPPGPTAAIAQGHGLAALQAADRPGAWRVVIHLDEGWHVNASTVTDKYLVPTELRLAGFDADIHYPQGVPLSTKFAKDPLDVYSGSTSIDISEVPVGAEFEIELRTQACSDQVCLAPERHWLRFPGH